MSRIGEQRERSRDHASDDLQRHEERDDHEGRGDAPFIRAGSRSMSMIVLMTGVGVCMGRMRVSLGIARLAGTAIIRMRAGGRHDGR
jgi:hypothetical protein